MKWKEDDLEEKLSPEDKARSEKIRLSIACHEAAHAVTSVIAGQNVEYASIRTEGTDYRAVCRSTTTGLKIPGKDTTIPFVGRYTDLALSGKTLKSRYLHCDLQNTTPSFNVYPGGNSHRHTEERSGPGTESSSIPLWWTLPINFLLKPERGP